MDDEWDLHAVVRSCTTISNAATRRANVTTPIEEYNKDDFDVLETVACKNDINSFSYSLFSPWVGLEEVYKEGCSQRLKTNEAAAGFVDDEPLHEMLFDPSDPVFNETPSRKRKNQQKKWVVELTQEELCSDTWAWRKYGQKLIKGSPFPRNYYKCSTLKACGARKQVEQSHMNPSIFIVSYLGEHIHPRPIHKSPLAGSTRSNKPTAASIPSIANNMRS
ncbi:hypothetical protein M8C21_009280 [Ambrosia artemisiifolia]|uniref:WRKY domain-containing protein n=1 Tax=Ambrosia artemisiifolia TaxID=4212 RepID=A0AAD5C2G8_AMBAR|nr:hypothetical protein M8C21_009280 [Ambrosia artemisiifolia]